MQMDSIEGYVEQFEELRKAWIAEFTSYMKEKHSELEAVIWFRMPTYRKGCYYIAFSVAKQYFAVHTNDPECFRMLQEGLDKAAFGKRSAKIKYSDEAAKRVIYNAIEFFVFHQRTQEENESEVETNKDNIIAFSKV